MKLLDAESTRQLEAEAVAGGASYLELMEQAGAGAADEIVRRYSPAGQNVLILCGKGNNGGDGFVIARHLCKAGARVSVLLTMGHPTTPDAGEMFERLKELPVEIHEPENLLQETERLLRHADLIVDAVFGIGFYGPARPPFGQLFEAVNECGKPVVAVDIPSGLDCDSGRLPDFCIKAGLTVTFSTMKPAQVVYPAAAACGETVVREVGIPKTLTDTQPPRFATIDTRFVMDSMPKRDPQSHKGTFGKLLCICGSVGMTGAAVLSTSAALRCGAGLVYLAAPKDAVTPVACHVVEAVLLPMEQNSAGTLSAACMETLKKRLKTASACLIGCGIGDNDDTEQIACCVMETAECPIIVDADGINVLSRNIDRMKRAKAPLILTPHPGEMARLCGKTVTEVQERRLETAMETASRLNATVVLKGAHTIVAAPDGRVFVNLTGNAGMARGGSGDLLAGMIASFAAQGMEPAKAAVCGVHLHGMAGDRAAERLSMQGMLPGDMLHELPELFNLSK
ncbi:MAG: NAD(P)H-hydrate dehydratase [Clostridiales bacterium]|nr:NAD(P)H-hydrate dehydratase [Clostridiales bacterium]